MGVQVAFGEKFSILQLIGFIILISGTLVYNVIFRVPGFDYTSCRPALSTQLVPSAPAENALESLSRAKSENRNENREMTGVDHMPDRILPE